MNIIGEIKLKINGDAVMCKITEDGYAITPDETRVKLPSESFELIQRKLEHQRASEPGQSTEEPDEKAEDEKQGAFFTATHQNELTGSAEEQKQPKEKEEGSDKRKTQTVLMAVTMLMSVLTLAIVLFAFLSPQFSAFEKDVDSDVPPMSDPDTSTVDPLPKPEQPTQQELDEAKSIVIVARIVTPEGEEKEVVLGYFTTDGEEDDLPNVGQEAGISGDKGMDDSSFFIPPNEGNGQIVTLSSGQDLSAD